MVSMLPLDPRFTVSNAAKGDELIRAIEICSMPSLGGEVRPSAPCHKSLQHIKNPKGV
jgi:hypothetical protein